MANKNLESAREAIRQANAAKENKYMRDNKWVNKEEAMNYDEDKSWKENEYNEAIKHKKEHPLTAPGMRWTQRDIEKRLKERNLAKPKRK